MRFSLSDDVYCDEDEDELQEEEPVHPLGFQSPFGKTWISLDPPTPSQVNAAFGRTSYGWSDDYDSDDDEETKENMSCYIQSFPPLSAYIRSENATTATLLAADQKSRRNRHKPKKQQQLPLLTSKEREDELKYSDDEDDDYPPGDDVLPLVIRSTPTIIPPPMIPVAIQEALSTSSPSQRIKTEQKIRRKIQAERQRVDEECRRNLEILSKLVLKSQEEAAAILKQRQAEAAAAQVEKAKEARAEQERQAKEARDIQLDQAQKKKDDLNRQHQQELAATDQQKLEAEEGANKKVDYIEKAKERVKYVMQVRKTIEPFEQNKAIGKRRLGMKKIARGKLNTLSENAHKVQEVAAEVLLAITQARQDDALAKQALEQNKSGVTPDMKIGKRYFLDLLASNAMTRVQAESFSGVKGDGFPLAAMLSMISVENKDFAPILEGHIYMVCPTAIPTLPRPKPNANEEDLMTGLGMQTNKNGEFESFPQFLARTENIISFMANIQASLPTSNGLMGGNIGAVKWLQRFLDLLPPSPTVPLPLITAPVLSAFLNGAGHMLANKHADTFNSLLDTIVSDIVNRLDEGEIGKPSAIRLRKVLDGGFEQFRTNLPVKAIPELYLGASGESKKHTEGSLFGGTIGEAGKGKEPYNDWGQNTTPQNQGFGRVSSTSSKPPCQNFLKGDCRFGENCRYSHETGNAGTTFGGGSFGSIPASNPFGGSSGTSPTISTSSFGAASTVSGTSENPFGSYSGTSSTFGSSGKAPSPSPFASSSSAPMQSPFGSAGNNMQQASPFGVTPNSNTGFGTMTSNRSSFGISNSSAVNPSPFGDTSSASRFGGSSNSTTNPFGGTNKVDTTPSPFSGNTVSMTNPSPFSGGNSNTATVQSIFGGAGDSIQNSSPFGTGGSTTRLGTSTISNSTPIGASAPSPSPFTSQVASPFGVPANATQPFGLSTNPNPSPFGGAQTVASPSPFSIQNQNTPFGGNSTLFGSSGGTTPSPFGGFGGTQVAPSPSPFSSQAMSPFGATKQSFGLGSNSNSAFGSSSFAGSTVFGGTNQQQHQGFGSGGGNKTQPCKFYAKGQCRYGANCRYSHDFAASTSNSVFGSGNTSGFGSNFGGFGTNTPFGGPRR
jgi:hypothetical protein